MKRVAEWVFPILFLIICAVVIWFLHLFTVNKETMEYIDWQSAVQVLEDGTEQPYDITEYTNSPQVGGVYRFTAQLSAELNQGYLLFETSGEELVLTFRGEEIYRSSATLQDAAGMSQAMVYLPENPEGELVVTCTLLEEGTAMFPPLMRFIPSNLEATDWITYANYYGFPAGACALALVLGVGLFLLSISQKKVEWSLLPLLVALVFLLSYRIIQSCGYYFLPLWVTQLFSRQEFSLVAPLALLVFLAMNRRRDFWRYLGLCAAWSAGGLLVWYLISLLSGGYLSAYLTEAVSDLFQYGIYDGLLYWVTLWLAIVCALISAFQVFRSFVRQRTETKTLRLKNKLVLDGYQAIQQKMRSSAQIRHEFRHQLTAMDALYQQNKLEQLGQLIHQLRQEEDGQAQTEFTKNFTVNAILQDAAARSVQRKVSFDAQARIPSQLTIPENDLCVLLMNLLDNALEAAAQVKNPQERWVRFKAEVKNGFLAVRCQNSYSGTLKEDEKGHLLTTKSDAEIHGFGMLQMSAVAEKYQSLLDVSYSEDGVFTVQTALKLPHPPKTS